MNLYLFLKIFIEKEFYIYAKAFLIFLILSFVANGWRVHGI
jgi:hypothetical protein